MDNKFGITQCDKHSILQAFEFKLHLKRNIWKLSVEVSKYQKPICRDNGAATEFVFMSIRTSLHFFRSNWIEMKDAWITNMVKEITDATNSNKQWKTKKRRPQYIKQAHKKTANSKHCTSSWGVQNLETTQINFQGFTKEETYPKLASELPIWNWFLSLQSSH